MLKIEDQKATSKNGQAAKEYGLDQNKVELKMRDKGNNKIINFDPN